MQFFRRGRTPHDSSRPILKDRMLAAAGGQDGTAILDFREQRLPPIAPIRRGPAQFHEGRLMDAAGGASAAAPADRAGRQAAQHALFDLQAGVGPVGRVGLPPAGGDKRKQHRRRRRGAPQGPPRVAWRRRRQGAGRHGSWRPAHPARRRGAGQAIAFFRFSSILARKAWVFSQGWSLPIRMARSLVMKPASTVSTQTFSSAFAKSVTSGVPSNLPR